GRRRPHGDEGRGARPRPDARRYRREPDREPGPARPALPDAALRGTGCHPELSLLVARLRHGTGLPPPPARPEAPAVALSRRLVEPEEPARPVLSRRLRRGLSRRAHHLDAPRSGQGLAVGMSADRDRALTVQ